MIPIVNFLSKIHLIYWMTFMCVYIYTYESKYECKSNSMKKAEKQNNPNKWIYCDVKSMSNVSVSITFIKTLILNSPIWIILFFCFIGLVGRVFANGPGDLGSIQVTSYQRLLEWYLIPPGLTLTNIRYVSRGKWSNPGKGVVPSPTPWCSSYWKGSLLVTLDYSRQLSYLLIYIYTYKYSYIWLVVSSYGISILLSCLMPNPLYIYIYIYIYIYDLWTVCR